MPDFEFRLRPWEYDGTLILPVRELDARVEGRARRFEVKSHEGYLYFRCADEGNDERVWSLLEPSPNEDIEEHFRREVKANRVARFFAVERGFSTRTVSEKFRTELKARFHPSRLWLLEPTTFAVTLDDEGNGFAQEWCGGEWFPFSLRARRTRRGAFPPSIWSRSWNVAGLKGALARLAGEFAFRPFSPDFLNNELGFACGSKAQLETLFHAAVIISLPHYANLAGKRRRMRFDWSIDAASAQHPLFSSSGPYNSVFPDELLSLFLAHNVPTGGQWHPVNRPWYEESEDHEPVKTQWAPDIPTLRVDFSFHPHGMHFTADIPIEPSAHEQLEARLTLRDFLEDKWPRERIAALLG